MINLIFEICKKGRRGQSEIHFDRKSLRCNFKKGSSTTVQSYKPTEEEIRMQKMAADYAEATAPNALKLNNSAAGLLWSDDKLKQMGTEAQAYSKYATDAREQIGNATNSLNDLIGSNTSVTNATNKALDKYTSKFNNASNTANKTLGNIDKQYTKAGNTVNKTLGTLSPQYQNAANATNGLLGSLSPQYTSAINGINQELGSLSPQYQNAISGTNQALNSLSPQYQNAISGTNQALNSLSPQYQNAIYATNQTLGSLSPQYQMAALLANGQLSGLANGYIPQQYQTNMENAIRSGLENTMGNTINSLGQRGVLNSSVTNAAMNDISRNAADTVAQQYQNNINTIGNLTQQQLGNQNTVLGAQSQLAQQQLGNTAAGLEAQGNWTQQQLGNTAAGLEAQGNWTQQQLGNTAAGLEAQGNWAQQRLGNTAMGLEAQAGLAQQQLGNTNTALGAQGELAQQQFGNTNAVLGARGDLAQQKLANTNNSLESQLGVKQNQLSNTMNTNQFNSGLLGSLIDSASLPITVTAAAQEAAQQPALNLWNASLGLNQGGTGTALAGVSGKGTTTTTQSQSGGFLDGMGGVLGGLASGWASTWCFAEDTLVKMADGTAKYIQDIVKGDKVLCPHMDGTETEEEVLDVMEPHHADVYAVTAKDRDGGFHVVLTTSTQPLLCENGKFVTVGNMKLGKILRGGLELISIEYDEFCKVYDLKVSGENNYYADGFVAKGGTIEW